MENDAQMDVKVTKHFLSSNHPLRPLFIILIVSIILGGITGYVMVNKGGSGITGGNGTASKTKEAAQDTGTFRDFAEGTIKLKATPKESTDYSEGTHILERDGAVPVALTSSVVDLSIYENKKVKVFGETQKALKEGWLMDVGKIEEIK